MAPGLVWNICIETSALSLDGEHRRGKVSGERKRRRGAVDFSLGMLWLSTYGMSRWK